MATDELRAAVDALEWHHTMDLGGGVVTPGRDATEANLARIQMPASLAGKTVLDIGAWDGFYSFEAERRGADRVVRWITPSGATRVAIPRRRDSNSLVGLSDPASRTSSST